MSEKRREPERDAAEHADSKSPDELQLEEEWSQGGAGRRGRTAR
jgi:hypothetical protein